MTTSRKQVDHSCESGKRCSPGTCTKCSPAKERKGKPAEGFIVTSPSFMEDQQMTFKPVRRDQDNVDGQTAGHVRKRRSSWTRASLMPNLTFQDDEELKTIVNFGGSKDHLGKGSYGSVQRIKLVHSGLVRALKKIDKAVIDNMTRLKREILIMKILDHPNIIRLHDVWESPESLYLCMEVLTGGELFDEIVAKKQLSEKETATIMSQLLSVVAYIHKNNIAHRDLKPENILFTDQTKHYIKVIDWGFALKCEGEHRFSSVVGTPYYVAPEVLYGNYNHKCDVWSCGVIMYILLCGYPPFYGNDNKEILRRVKQGEYYFDPKSWRNVSEHAKDLVRRFLCYDAEHRPHADVASKHPWIQYYSVLNGLSSGSPTNVQLKSQKHILELRDRIIRLFKPKDGRQTNANLLKQLLLTTAAVNLSPLMQTTASATYNAVDTNKRGYLLSEDIVKYLVDNGVAVDNSLREAIEAMDTDQNGYVDYTEFLLVSVEERFLLSQKIILQTFRTICRTLDNGAINSDASEELTVQHLRQLIASRGVNGSEEANVDADAIFAEFFSGTKDKDLKRGRGSLDEKRFVDFMQKCKKSGLGGRAKSLFGRK